MLLCATDLQAGFPCLVCLWMVAVVRRRELFFPRGSCEMLRKICSFDSVVWSLWS